MPSRKRGFDDFDPNKSDPEDEDFDVRANRSRVSKALKMRRGKPSRKKRRMDYGADGSEDISESDLSDVSFDEAEEERSDEPEVDPHTGRPVRKVSKKQVQYQESDGDSIDFMNNMDSGGGVEPTRKLLKRSNKRKQLIVKLKTPQQVRRTTRARSGSTGLKKPGTIEIHGITRRSSRIAHDDTEGLFALTNSGNHVEVTRPATKSPEALPSRVTKGGKGLKKPPSAIFEAEEESSRQASEQLKTEEYNSVEFDPEIAASRDDLDINHDGGGGREEFSREKSDAKSTIHEGSAELDVDMMESAVVLESAAEEDREHDVSDDNDDDDVLSKPRRAIRRSKPDEVEEEGRVESGVVTNVRSSRRALRSSTGTRPARSVQRTARHGMDDTSDFEPGAEEGAEENLSSSSSSDASPRKPSQDNDDSSSNARRSRRLRGSSRHAVASAENDSEEADELAEELQELRESRPRRKIRPENSFDERPQTRKRKPVDYRILRPDLNLAIDDEGPPTAVTPSRRGRGGAGGTWQRSLFSTYGPFGGAGGPPPVFSGPGALGAAGGVDSDSSEDDATQRPRPARFGGAIGMTPTSGAPPGFGLFSSAQTHTVDPLQTNFGKIKDKQALADSDPLGVDPNVNFDGVGGLQGHIDQLKEMVALPLLYPEVFQRFHVTPPRGVLFHGPPGTGKTLLARALASSVSSEGRKVTFYMRKGADALSKWVGEAERQLRLLFEEARKTQPSIIFFDEIDGLAPVRSSKQDQIHASIVSTLLALMDGMDGRGQVIVIGATNRPDSVDPALRRPGRFDREFYFPLPNTEARRSILDIHTRDWHPPVSSALKNELAQLTKGYGGADLRALCTEAALNAVQRRYPQIYRSNEKLQIQPETISVAAKDFMISIKKIIPSSERSASSGASPLPSSIEPLLRQSLQDIKQLLSQILPQKRVPTALEEAQFEDAASEGNIGLEKMQQEFERSRVYRPRLCVRGTTGMGQQYLASALIHHFEGLHVQSFDLATLLNDSTRSAEAATVQLFSEVKRHKPSVIYIPNINTWYRTIGDTVISTFLSLLRSLPPTDPVLLLGVLETEDGNGDFQMMKNFFGFSKRNQFILQKPTKSSRIEFFQQMIDYLETSPTDFPNPADRKKRVLETLPTAPPEPPKAQAPLTKDQMKLQKKQDRQLLNLLKVRIQPIMEQIKSKYKKFRTGVIDENAIRYLFDEDDPSAVSSDLPHELRSQATFRPYEKGKDERGEPGLIESSSGKFFYNLEIVTIEKRLSNGYYKRPKDFLADIKKLTKDAKTIGEPERLLRASELQANVEVDIGGIEDADPLFTFQCEALYQREIMRENEKMENLKRLVEADRRLPEPIVSNIPPANIQTNDERPSEAIVLNRPHTTGVKEQPPTSARPSNQSSLTNGISDLSDLHPRHHESHSTSDPSRTEDVTMINHEDSSSTQRDTQSSSFGPSAQTRPMHFHTGAPASLQQRQSYPGSLSQKSAITPMAEGSNPRMYENSASTTSSDKRMTGSSGPFATPSVHGGTDNTIPSRVDSQSSNGPIEGGVDMSTFWGQPPSHSQLLDTQEPPQSQQSVPNSSQSQPSSQPPVPAFPRNQSSAIHSLLNADPGHPPLIVDSVMTRDFFEELVDSTSPCTVEQLEQVYSVLMSEIWRTRGVWNRLSVVDSVRNALRELLEDMTGCQDFGPSSADMDR